MWGVCTAKSGTAGREPGRIANSTAAGTVTWAYHSCTTASVAQKMVRSEDPRSQTADRTEPGNPPDPAGRQDHTKRLQSVEQSGEQLIPRARGWPQSSGGSSVPADLKSSDCDPPARCATGLGRSFVNRPKSGGLSGLGCGMLVGGVDPDPGRRAHQPRISAARAARPLWRAPGSPKAMVRHPPDASQPVCMCFIRPRNGGPGGPSCAVVPVPGNTEGEVTYALDRSG